MAEGHSGDCRADQGFDRPPALAAGAAVLLPTGLPFAVLSAADVFCPSPGCTRECPGVLANTLRRRSSSALAAASFRCRSLTGLSRKKLPHVAARLMCDGYFTPNRLATSDVKWLHCTPADTRRQRTSRGVRRVEGSEEGTQGAVNGGG